MNTVAPFLLLLALAIGRVLPAQQGTPGSTAARTVQVVDLAPFLPRGTSSEPLATPASVEAIRVFVHDFARPAFGPGDDLATLGGRWLAVLARPESHAWVTALLGANGDAKRGPLELQVQLLKLTEAAFADEIAPLLPALGADPSARSEVRRRAFAPKDTAGLEAVLARLVDASRVDLLTAPKVTAVALAHTTLSSGTEVPYVADFEVRRTAKGLAAEPVVEKLFDGVNFDLVWGSLPNGLIGVRCSLVVQAVRKPIPEFSTTLGEGLPVTIQLPRADGWRIEQSVEIQEGGAILLATPDDHAQRLAVILTALPSVR